MEETPAILRTKAATALRLASATLDPALVELLLRFAEECEERAARLEQTQKQNPREDI
jgi:hypothetical protein